MKNALKISLLCALGMLSSITTQASSAKKDSLIITFGDKTRMIIYSDDRKELEKLMKYDLNTLLKDLGARLDTMQGETKVYFDDLDGRKYLKDTTGVGKDKNYVRINLRGIRIKDGDTEVTITTRGVDIKDGSDHVKIGKEEDKYESDTTGNSTGDDDEVTPIRRVRRYSSPRKGFNIALGLNTYSQNQPMGLGIDSYDLRPFGSRYVALGYVKSATLARGKGASLHLDFGLDVAWNNLMFEGNNTVVKTPSELSFRPVLDNEGREVNLDKSKLVVPYLDFTLMPTVSFPKSIISYMSAGGYIGYRLGGYTKTKLTDGEKDRVRSDYYLNDVRYGVAFELGIRKFPDFFVHYDLNTLFQNNRGPEVKMINFGIRF